MVDPVAPIPDDKNWTWVIDRPCPECGFDATKHAKEKTGAEIRGLAAKYRALLKDSRATTRPEPTVWSALEYACHVRDVYPIYLGRLRRMITEDAPTYANWDQDQTALEERYWTQEPAKVSYDLARSAGEIATEFDHVRPDQWSRTGQRSDGATFTIEGFAAYLLHDVIHHVWDIVEGYDTISGR